MLFRSDHQLMLKGPAHYQGVIRVPFIWSDPLATGATQSRALLQSTDLAPSILQRAGVPAFNGMQGLALAGLFGGAAETPTSGSVPTRSNLVIEEEGQRVYMGFPQRIRMRSFLDGRYRMSLYEGVPWGELYDLQRSEEHTSELQSH